jgi:hypothetical protein
MFFIQTFTSTQNLHWKPTEHGKFSKQNNQLPTKTPIELKDNSIAALKFRQFTIWTNIIILELLQLDKVARLGTWSKLDNHKIFFIYMMTPQTYSSCLDFFK